MLDILKESKYTVGEAEKTKDGYEMQVEVEPITGVFDDLEAPTRERMAAYAKENKEKILDGTIPPEEADDEVSRTYISAVRENMENISDSHCGDDCRRGGDIFYGGRRSRRAYGGYVRVWRF